MVCFEQPVEVEVIVCLGRELDFFEACGFLNHCPAQMRVVELGVILANESVFRGKGLDGVGESVGWVISHSV